MSTPADKLIALLENTAGLLQKTQANLKKCPKQRLTKSYIEVRLQTVEDYWNTFKTAHQDLVKCVPKEKKQDISYFVNEDYFIVEDLYLCMQSDMRDILANINKISTEGCVTNTSRDSQVKLPRIQIPTFSGYYEEWPTFQDLYSSLVHNNATLTKVQKLHYLKNSLAGEAMSLLKHIHITDDNYDEAWILLKGRYGNKRIIVNSILRRLFTQRKIPAQTSSHIKSLVDTTSECITSLRNLNISTDSWDPLIIFLVVQKLDPETHRSWEEYAYRDNCEELPAWEELCKFLHSRYRTLELINPYHKEKLTNIKNNKEFRIQVAAASTSKIKSCIMCKQNHTLCHCRDFTKMETTERCQYVKNQNLCFNCLAPGHTAKQCRLNMSCRICKRRHHSLMHQTSMTSPNHPDDNSAQEVIEQNQEYSPPSTNQNVNISSHFTESSTTALLATALINVKDQSGHVTILRALIDQGSQATFISERAAQALRLRRTAFNGSVSGIGCSNTKIRQAANIELLSRHDGNFTLSIKVYIMPTNLTSYLPTRIISSNKWPHLDGLSLADPGYHKPGRIDLLCGVDVCAHIMKGEIIKGPPGTPCAQNTSLGWILFGHIQHKENTSDIRVMHLNINLDDMLKQMWEQKKDEKRLATAEERKCEEIYQATTTRSADGRYIVKLPTKSLKLLSTEGNTRTIALQRLFQLEGKFRKDPNLKREYVKVMQEYIDLNHMEVVPKDELNQSAVYLPHHAVIKEDKETSKIRTVFNASQKGNNNVSLNDELLVGPQLQEDMRSLIMRWRMRKICFVADIQKMYRQILVSAEDRNLQRIVWRNNTKEPVQDYRLKRLTFGTGSAPYLAVRTLFQVANDEGQNYSEASKIIKEDFYMDDLMSGKDSLEDAIRTAKEVEQILKKGGFILQKWCSNDAIFLKQFDPLKRSSHVHLNIKIDGTIRALGLRWNTGEDVFEYSLNLPPITNTITKRTILADIQRLFDPLGWLAPSILPAKLLIQQLWLKGISWDEEVDFNIAEKWVKLRESFSYLPQIKIQRWLHTIENIKNDVSVHGFCDASTQGYAAVAYLRVQTANGKIYSEIIAAKTRVAPIKSQSLPRLELCGATLLAGLLKQIKEAMRIPNNQIYAWTDSTIVLSWLFGDPSRWNIFVRNRVVEILDNTIKRNWHHVSSQDNPADCATRGKHILELKDDKSWWYGPKWLSTKDVKYSRPEDITTHLETEENILVHVKLEDIKYSLSTRFDQFDNLIELLKAIIYCKRFLKGKNMKNKNVSISSNEMEEALITSIKIGQKVAFKDDMYNLALLKKVKNDSKLKSFLPYLDKDEILRVGGRLRHSDIDENSKHPIILDGDNNLTVLIAADAHLKTLHGGTQLMLRYLRSKYWILKAKRLVKLTIRKCLICAKLNAAAKPQIMGDLPRVRVTPARPFLNSGVDFAGPYQILRSKGRGSKTTKGYIAIFICMCTKAIHLELVSDMSSEAFIGAFRRFVARRGRCSHLWSDQGRNFVGANKELTSSWKQAKLSFDGDIANTLALDNTQWHFIPAYSPHMGGLWEAGVKSMKYHLKRILTCNLTYEEMTTLLCQIEACLNSRPLTPVDESEIDALLPLTPGHFLIGESPINIPYPDLQDIPFTHLSRWQHLQKLLSDFWRRWQQEYLCRLQQRPKWQKKTTELEKGNIVLIKADNLPPGKWVMGRIVDKHPGADGVTRVYSVKSGESIVRRSINKLCPLPIDVES